MQLEGDLNEEAESVFRYSSTIAEAKKDGVGNNPMILKAEDCVECDVILSDDSIDKLKEALEKHDFLKEGKVSVAIGG